MKLRIELEEEADGRWIGAIPELPGALSYGKTRTEAALSVVALGLQIIADELQNGEQSFPSAEDNTQDEFNEQVLAEFTLAEVRVKFSMAA